MTNQQAEPGFESKIWSCPQGCGYHIADGPVPDGEPTTTELIQEHLDWHAPTTGEPTDLYAKQRAAYVAGLRELADWWEQHTEIPPERSGHPSISYRPAFHGERMEQGDDAEGLTRLAAMAAALGVPVDLNPGSVHPRAERHFGPIRVAASYVLAESYREHCADMDLLREVKRAGLTPPTGAPDLMAALRASLDRAKAATPDQVEVQHIGGRE